MRVVWSIEARQDMVDVYDFLLRQSEDRWLLVSRRIESAIEDLPKMPARGRPRPELGRGVRGLGVSGFIVFYRLSKGELHILQVIHAARDTEALLRPLDDE